MESIQQTLPTIYLRDIASFKKRDSHHNVPMQGLRLGAVKGLGKGHWADSGKTLLEGRDFLELALSTFWKLPEICEKPLRGWAEFVSSGANGLGKVSVVFKCHFTVFGSLVARLRSHGPVSGD